MILEIQKKMWKSGLDLSEKTLETLYKDKTFLKLSSMGLNMNLWWQKSLGKTSNWLFSGLNVPTDDNIKSLLAEIHELENQFDLQEDRIRSLESEIDSLKEKLPKRKAVSKTTPKTATRTRARKTQAADSAYSH